MNETNNNLIKEKHYNKSEINTRENTEDRSAKEEALSCSTLNLCNVEMNGAQGKSCMLCPWLIKVIPIIVWH